MTALLHEEQGSLGKTESVLKSLVAFTYIGWDLFICFCSRSVPNLLLEE